MIPKAIAFYRAVRLPFLYVLMTAIVFGPAIERITGMANIRVNLLSLVPILVLFVLNDAWNHIAERLKVIGEGINNPEPPSYENFTLMEPALTKVIDGYVKRGTPLTIQVIGVSSMYSWRYLEHILTGYLRNPPEKLSMTVEIAVTAPATLVRWNLASWRTELQHAVTKFRQFEEKNRENLPKAKISARIYFYDNLPHWHGVLVNGEVLFMGRTSWVREGDHSDWELLVGQVEYRRFESDDGYGGASRIRGFRCWFSRYKDRDGELGSEDKAM